MQQVAFEGAKQNECLEDGAERLLDAAERLWAIGYGRGTIAALVALAELEGRGAPV